MFLASEAGRIKKALTTMAQTTNRRTVSIADSIIDGGTFRMNWNTGKLERCQDAPELPRGTIVHGYGGGMEHSRWAMTGEGRQMVKLSENYEDSYFSNPFHTLDRYAEPIEKKFGIGFYYDLNATPATDAEIEAAIERGNAFIAEREAAKAEAARAWSEAVEAVRKQYAGMFEEKPAGSYYDSKHVAKNVRKDLAAAFPGCKFSVRKYSYSDIRVEWVDGPTEKEVKAVCDKHTETCERDRWNDDLWDHKDTPFTSVFGGVEYIWYDRAITPERLEEKQAEIEAAAPETKGQGVHQYDLNDGHAALWEIITQNHDALHGLNWYDSASMARCILCATSFYQAPATKEKKAAEKKAQGAAAVSADGVQILDYSEKALAVVGNTKPIAGTLKALGGRFNFRLSCGAGWIFSKSKETELRAALSL